MYTLLCHMGSMRHNTRQQIQSIAHDRISTNLMINNGTPMTIQHLQN